MTVPRATLRLQFHAGFTFDDAAKHLDYFAALGVSHLYASPITTARPGSLHGYDAVDYSQVNEELGGEAGLKRLVARLRERDMGLVIDIVPNHMGIGAHNAWWLDVLEWGRHSAYARHFDIDWHSPDPALRGKVLMPCLGAPYGVELEAGRIALRFHADSGRFQVVYGDNVCPICPVDYAAILQAAEDNTELTALAQTFEGLTTQPEDQPRAAAGREALRTFAAQHGPAAFDPALEAFAGTAAVSHERLHRLLERQHFRLAWWRTASDEVNWRRFFDISTLAAVRVERPEVFEAVHALVFRLYEQGLIDGVRIDHVDGLAEPREYCQRLRQRLVDLRGNHPYIVVEKILGRGERLRDDWPVDGTTGYDFMNDVGSLLHDPDGAAPLAATWAELTGASPSFADEAIAARRQILAEHLSAELDRATRALHRIARDHPTTRDFTFAAIRRVVAELAVHFPVYRIYPQIGLRSNADNEWFAKALDGARRTLSRSDHEVLARVDAWLGGSGGDAERDARDARDGRGHRAAAAGSSQGQTQAQVQTQAQGQPQSSTSAAAQKARPAAPPVTPFSHALASQRTALTLFSQLTAPLAAKAIEDTAGYRYGRLLSRNEVGADAGEFAITVEQFHAANQERRRRFPHAMLATSTHDHKRGEDVRARLAVLSELAPEWSAALRRWSTVNAPLRRFVEGGAPAVAPASDAAGNVPDPQHWAPGPAAEAMLYQTLVGCWPPGLAADDEGGIRELAERIAQWQLKALREAKQRTSWYAPDEAFERACRDFLFDILAPQRRDGFLRELCDFVERIAPAGAVNSLQQTVLQLTSPGVPDLYQGTELWDFSLVDPDNRRPVDFAARAAALAPTPPSERLREWRNGHVKLGVVQRLLALRAQMPEVLGTGVYLPLTVRGTHAKRAIAFVRQHGNGYVVVICTRLAAPLLESGSGLPLVEPAKWEDTAVEMPAGLASRTLMDLLSPAAQKVNGDGLLYLRDALAAMPVAVLLEDGVPGA
ncbi:malto-oligosyltrehalose synthase [Paraburkholderia kururiensis]|uniref:Malto-oligosyltrehalose synthase n=1 Tax=Paraburkholderia kururiensis TaxID=984307 RepID=A0ABZ0WNS2_9BURK|nr:malto-oligosyltrehalose synthase [Paraburkholderia kururiensis]WQD78986.1 malto-oligosyltrehalose synthase [Paraburkholderia kururiensis]